MSTISTDDAVMFARVAIEHAIGSEQLDEQTLILLSMATEYGLVDVRQATQEELDEMQITDPAIAEEVKIFTLNPDFVLASDQVFEANEDAEDADSNSPQS